MPQDHSVSASNNGNATPVYGAFLEQFAENQNHHQKLFIHFLSSVAIVLGAYAFVYTNTIGYDGIIVNSKTIKPQVFTSVKSDNGDILSYGLIHLVIIYMFVQILLSILSCIVLHMGYSFRRDQVVVSRMRRKILGEADFTAIFGKESYSGLHKSIIDYLPNFNSILFFALLLIQSFVYVSIYSYFNNYPPDEIFLKDLFNVDVSYAKAKFSLFFPIPAVVILYFLYFYKYNRRVSKAELYQQITPVSSLTRKFLFRFCLASTLLASAFFFMGYITKIYLFAALGMIHIIFALNYYLTGTLLIKKDSEILKNLFLGVTFWGGSAINIFISINRFTSPDEFYHIRLGMWFLFIYLSILFFILLFSEKEEKHLSNIGFLIKQINLEITLIFFSTISIFLINLTGLKWIDKACFLSLGILLLILSLRWFSSAFRMHFQNQTL